MPDSDLFPPTMKFIFSQQSINLVTAATLIEFSDETQTQFYDCKKQWCTNVILSYLLNQSNVSKSIDQ